MSRRAKIKVTANLTSRRSESKSKIEISTAKNVFAQCDEILSIKVEKGNNQKQIINVTAIQEDTAEDVTTTIDEKSINGADVKPSESSSKKKIENVNENVSEDEPASKKIKSDTVSIIPPIVSTLPDDENTFKTPSNVTRVDENATQSLSISGNTSLLQQQQQQKSNKFRRQKIIPRLAATRTPKVEEIELSQKSPTDDISDVFDEQLITKQQPETNVFEDWPIPPLSPSKQRFESIKEYHDPLLSPIIINNNLQPPPVPTSPFPHHPQHSRVRTESLCSMKSTMSAYNKDISGVVRKNFRTEENNRIIDTKRESKERLNNKNLEKNQLRMFDMIYYNPTSNPMKTKTTPAREKEQKKPLKLDVKLEAPVVKIKEPDSIANFLVPQLKLGPNGEMILDETSLVVENEQQKQNRILLANANVVYDDELSGTYGYYTRQKRTREWPADETVKFYRCLHTIGTDFSLMLNLFPNRTRRDLKLKFKKEEKSNGALINKALLHPNMFDIDELQRELDNDEKIKKKALETKSKAESNELLKKGIMKKHQAAKDKMKKKTKVERILSDGDLVLNLANDNLQEAVKENLLVPMPEKKPRKSRKKAEIKVPEMSIIQELIADNPTMAVSKIEERFAELMPDNKMSFTISAKEESYQNSGESLVTNGSNQLNYTNNNTYFYDEMGNRIECELMNEEDLVVIDMPEDIPSSIPNHTSYNPMEPSTEMDQNYNCDASDDGSVRSFQTVFYNENGVNHDPEPMDIEMNEQEEILNEQIEEPQGILSQQIEKHQEIANIQKVEYKAAVKVEKRGHRRILIDEEDEEDENELNNEDQEMLKELNEDENENIDLKHKCKVEPAEILNTKVFNGFKKEQFTQPIINTVVATVITKKEQFTQSIINTVEAEDIAGEVTQDHEEVTEDHEEATENHEKVTEDHEEVTEYHEEVAEVITVKNEKMQTSATTVIVLPEFPAQDIIPDVSWSAEEIYQSTNEPEVQEKLNPVDDEQQNQSEEIITSTELSSQDTSLNTSLNTSWNGADYYLPTNDPDVKEKMNVVDVFHLQPTTSTVIAPVELPVKIHLTSWNPDAYYQATNDPDVQEKMNVIDIPCTSSAGQDEYEDLMKSIDFNSLVLAESQVDGKTVNEIYTMDSITEEISEKPLNLPQHVVDKIVSILNSADSDDEDA